jgi:hypothetical protein
MMLISGQTDRLISIGPGGGCVLWFKPRNSNRIKVVIRYDVTSILPAPGSCFRIKGKYQDSVFGEQFIAEEIVAIEPWGDEIIGFLSEFPAIRCLSWRVAAKLWKKFGSDLYFALDSCDAQFFAKLLNPRQCAKIFRQWKEYGSKTKLSAHLSNVGMPPDVAQSLFEMYGYSALALVKENPYRLSLVCAWDQVDRLCNERAWDQGSREKRQSAAVLSALAELRDFSGAAVDEVKLIAKLKQKLGDAGAALSALTKALADGSCVRAGETKHIQGATLARIECALLDAMIPSHAVAQSNSRFLTQYKPPVVEVAGVAELLDIACSFKRTLLFASPATMASLSLITTTNILHIGQALFAADREFARLSAKNYITYSDALAMQLTPPQPEPDLIFVHHSERLSTLTLNKVLRSLPIGSALCLIADSTVAHQYFSPMVKRLAASTATKQIATALSFEGARATTTLDEVAISEWAFAADRNAQVSIRGIEFVRPSTPATLKAAVLAAYRKASDAGSAIILTMRKSTANELNAVLHAEHLEVKEQQGLSCVELRLQPGVNATVGSPIYLPLASEEISALSGAHGILTRIDQPAALFTNNGTALILVGEAVFETCGLTPLYRDQVTDLELGYAMRVVDRPFAMVDQVILFFEESRSFTAEDIRTACGLARHKCTIVGVDFNP